MTQQMIKKNTPVSFHNLKQTAKWGNPMYQQGENSFLMKAERYLWKYSHKWVADLIQNI